MSQEVPNRRVVAVLGSYGPSLVNFRGPLIATLVERGHKVVAMAPRLSSEVRHQVEALGANALEVPIGNQSLNPVSMIRTTFALAAAFRKMRVNLVIAYTIKPIVLGAPAARLAGVRSFVPLVTGLGYAFTGGEEPKRRISRLLASRLYRSAFRISEKIVFQNGDDEQYFRDLGIVPAKANVARVRGSGIDTDRFSPCPLPDDPSFLMIARFLGDKGVREYGAASAALKRRYPEARFRLVGYSDGSPDAIPAREIAQMERDGLELVGRLDDVRPAIAAASVYVLPSYREGMPRSVLEAMAMGRPIITTDAPGCRETVIEGENGFLVPPRDSRALQDAMEHFLIHPGAIHPFGRASAKLARERFEVGKVTDSLIGAIGL